MKSVVLILISSFLFLSCTNNKKSTETTARNNTDWNKLQLKGDVKSFREIKFLAVDNFSIISDGEKIKHIYNKEVLFNLDGYKIEKNDYIPDGTLANRTVFLYKEDKLVEYNNYDSQGILFGTGKYQTNDNGLVTELNYKTNDGRYNWSETYLYDKQGNVSEVNRFKSEEIIDSKELYIYGENGNVESSELHRANKLISKNKYNYDEEGNFNKLEIGDASVYTYIYSYDARGNWIKKIAFENENPSGILVREIEYFN